MNVVCIRFALWLRGSRTPSGTHILFQLRVRISINYWHYKQRNVKVFLRSELQRLTATFTSRDLTTDSRGAINRQLGKARLSELISKAHQNTVFHRERVPHRLVQSTDRTILTLVLDSIGELTVMTYNLTRNIACHNQPVVFALVSISSTQKI